jgi:hypothetical protein
MLDRITELRAQYRNKLLKKYQIGGTTPSWQNSSMKEVEDRSAFMDNFLTEEEKAAKEKAGLPQDSTIIPGSTTSNTGAGDGSGDVSFWTNLTNPQGWRNPFAQVDMGEDKTTTNPTQGLTSATQPNVTSSTGQLPSSTNPMNPGQAVTFKNLQGGANSQSFKWDPIATDATKQRDENIKKTVEEQTPYEATLTDNTPKYSTALGETKPGAKVEDKKQTELDRLKQLQLMLGAPAGDISTNFYNFGRAMGMKSGTKGKGLMAVGFGGAGLLGAARQTMSGVGYSKTQQYTDKYTRDQLLKNQNQYTAAAQTENTNNTGGISKFGGKFDASTNSFRQGGFFRYEDGGENEEELMQMADGENPGEVQQQEEGNPQEEKIIQIAQELVNGLGSLEAIDAYLREQKVDEQMYGMIMHVAEQILGESEQEQDQGEEMPEEGQEEPEMNEGGEFNKNVGDFIEFEYEGKKYSGKISKIENGQIYL